MSAIGSEMFIGVLPARLRDAGQLTEERTLPEADPAQGEPPHEGARPATHGAAVVRLHLVLRGPSGLGDHRLLGHWFSLSAYEAKGMPRSSRSFFDSSSVFAVVTMLISSPRRRSTLSYSISGNASCSRSPRLKLPRPSNDLPGTPRKSRIRGRARVVRRSRKSHIRSPRSVTLAPIVLPA